MDLAKIASFFANVGFIAVYLGFIIMLIFLAVSLAKMVVWPKTIQDIRKFYFDGLLFGLDLVIFGALVEVFSNSNPQNLITFFVIALTRFLFAILALKEEGLKNKNK